MKTARKKKEKLIKRDRHKLPMLVLRLPSEYQQGLREAAKKQGTTLTEQARIAFTEYLGKIGIMT